MPIDLSVAFKAARQNDISTLREAIAAVDVDEIKDDSGRTLLHHAVIALAEDAVEFLLVEAEINPDPEDNNGMHPAVLLAEVWGHKNEIAISIGNKLLDHGTPFAADSQPADWPKDSRTGLAMSAYKLRKYFPGFLETLDEDSEKADSFVATTENAPSP